MLTVLFAVLSSLFFAPLPEPPAAAPITAVILSANPWHTHWGTIEYTFTFDANGTYRADVLSTDDPEGDYNSAWIGKWSIAGNTLTVREWLVSNEDTELTWSVDLVGSHQKGFLGALVITSQDNRIVPLSMVRRMAKVP